MKKRILVLCTGNSCRSQMAEGFLRNFAGNRAGIYSAGIEAHGLNPMAVTVMKEAGIDISGQKSENMDIYRNTDFDYVITVCDKADEQCPVFPSVTGKFHHDFPDPSKASGNDQEVLEEFRKVRDRIRNYCEKFIKDNL